jgi:hypothetical protein
MSPTGRAATFNISSSGYEPGASPIAYPKAEVRLQNYALLGMMKGLVVEQS